MRFRSRRFLNNSRIARMRFIHALFLPSREVFFPFREPAFCCLPFRRCSIRFRTLPRDMPRFGIWRIAWSSISLRMSALVMASLASSKLAGSIQTLFSEHPQMLAASRFCIDSLMVLLLLDQELVLLFLLLLFLLF